METTVASIRAKTKARGVRVERPPAPPSVLATPVRLVSIQQAAGNLAIQKLFDSGQRKLQESSISPAMPAVAVDDSKESAIGQEQPKEPVTLAQTRATPEEDPAYQEVVKQLEVKAKKEKTPTKTAKQKQDETVLAANLPVEITSKETAYGEDLDKLAVVPQFTVGIFMKEFNQTIEKLAKTIPDKKGGPPQGYEAWDNKREQTAGELATAGRPTASQELEKQNKTHSDSYCTPTVEKVSDQVLTENQDLKSELKLDPVGRTPTLQQARSAAPKPKTEKTISLDEQSRALDDALVGHNVGGRTIDIDEASLAFSISGEKSFDEAGETKRRAQQEILKATPRYREQEKGVINKSEGEIYSLVNTTALQGHHARRSESFKGVLDKQEHHGGNIKKGKVTAFSQFETIYQETKRNVDAALKKINPDAIENKLTPILTAAEAYFASSVRTGLEYIYTPGHLGLDYSDWIDEHAAEVATETKKFKNSGEDDIPAYSKGLVTVQDQWAANVFKDAKTVFIGTVKSGVENEIAPMVVEALKEARNHIATGMVKVQTAHDRLSKPEKEQAEQVFKAVQGKFQSLEESVVEAQHEVITDMARTYNQSVGKLQSQFDDIKKDVLTSWLEKAWNKLKAIVNAIIEFATRIVELLGHMVGLVGDIISSPRAFFGNLITGISKGFSEFGRRIDEFLATAFFDWIRGTSGIQVQLPKEWNAAGIFSLFTQLLNLSTETIWQRMEVVYDTSVANAFRKGEVVLEKGLEIFDIVKREGLGGLWDHIVESLGTLLSDTLDEMKETVLYAAIKKVFIEIGKMLIPGGGFIAIAEKIIRLVVFIVEARNKILDLMEAFVSSMENAVNGDIAGIVKRVTTALTKFITVALEFLVAFFGLSGLKEKVERFIERMRNPVIRGIDFVLKKVKPLVMKGKELFVKGKEKVIAAGKVVVRTVAGWFGLTKTFTAADGKRHEIYFAGSEQQPQIMMSSTPDDVQDHINARRSNVAVPLTPAQEQSLKDADSTLRKIRSLTRPSGTALPETESIRPQIDGLLTTLAQQLQAGDIVVSVPLSNVTYTTVGPQKAGEVRADPLSSRAGNTRGGKTGASDPPGWVNSVETRAIADPRSYVRMHLLYHLLHGPGIAWNLVPAPQSINIGYMQPKVEIPLKNATDAGAVFRFSAKVDYPITNGSVDDFPNLVTVTWSILSAPPNVAIPTPPAPRSIPPPTFTGLGAMPVPDFNVLSFVKLQETGIPQDLSRAIVRARVSGTFESPSDFKQRVDAVLRTLYSPARTYQQYQGDLIAKRSQFILNGVQLSEADLTWP